MLTKAESALLALWNESTRPADEYNAWHTREHVLERLSIDGFKTARRYVKHEGDLPTYLTLYWLADISVLESDGYLSLLARPSERSRAMRPGMRQVLRAGSEKFVRWGGGVGGHAAVTLVKRDDGIVPALNGFLSQDMSLAICGATYAELSKNIESLPFEVDALLHPDIDNDALLILEGYDLPMLTRALCKISLIPSLPELSNWTTYRMAFFADESDALHSPCPLSRGGQARVA